VWASFTFEASLGAHNRRGVECYHMPLGPANTQGLNCEPSKKIINFIKHIKNMLNLQLLHNPTQQHEFQYELRSKNEPRKKTLLGDHRNLSQLNHLNPQILQSLIAAAASQTHFLCLCGGGQTM